jgi:protein-S-isoprenylcysteine O-methyltransferase Ste14
MAWAYLVLVLIILAVTGILMLRIDPELVAERSGVGQNTPAWDKVLTVAYGVLGLVTLLICGFDERWGWSGGVPPAVQVVALLLFLLADSFASWGLLSNAYFATTARIQNERGQQVVRTGPYRYLRHPGYAGWIVCNLVVPLIFDAWWAFVPAALVIGLLIVRTALEDRMLQKDLDGYREYTAQVRYRLAPGIW